MTKYLPNESLKRTRQKAAAPLSFLLYTNKMESKSRKVTSKDIFTAIIVVSFLLVIGWFKETGEKWAGIILAAIPLIGLILWIRLPNEQREFAEKQAKEELRRSRVLKIFLGTVVSIAAILILFWLYMKFSGV